MDSTVENCKFEQVDGEPGIEPNVAMVCGGCALKEVMGKATIVVDNDGFTNVIAGVCPRFGIFGPPPEVVETPEPGFNNA